MARKPHKKITSQNEDGMPQDDFTPSEEAFLGESEPAQPREGYELGKIIANTGDLGSDAEEDMEQIGTLDVDAYEEVSSDPADRTRRKLESTISSEEDDGINTSDRDDFLDLADFDSDDLPHEYE